MIVFPLSVAILFLWARPYDRIKHREGWAKINLAEEQPRLFDGMVIETTESSPPPAPPQSPVRPRKPTPPAPSTPSTDLVVVGNTDPRGRRTRRALENPPQEDHGAYNITDRRRFTEDDI